MDYPVAPPKFITPALWIGCGAHRPGGEEVRGERIEEGCLLDMANQAIRDVFFWGGAFGIDLFLFPPVALPGNKFVLNFFTLVIYIFNFKIKLLTSVLCL